MGDNLCQHFKTVQEKLDLERGMIDINDEFIITSGFVKIYALLVDSLEKTILLFAAGRRLN